MMTTAMPATAVATNVAQLDFNGLKLSAPMATMLDTLTLAALRLAAGDSAPPNDKRSKTRATIPCRYSVANSSLTRRGIASSSSAGSRAGFMSMRWRSVSRPRDSRERTVPTGTLSTVATSS